jgi:enamine deaminase RidA (YjgF/YER057c/UK114 family)
MELSFINPESVHKPIGGGYTHMVLVKGAGTIAYISGQVAKNQRGDTVGIGDLEVQTKQVYENISSNLKKIGATFSDVVKQNIYTVRPDQIDIIREVRDQYFPQNRRPASTLVGVTRLAEKDFLIEIEVVVALPQ